MLDAKQSAQDQTVAPISDGPAEVVAESVNINQSSIEDIQAELVRLVNSSATNVSASEVDVRQSFVMQLDGEQVDLHESASGIVRGETVNIQGSPCGVVQSSHAVIGSGSAIFVSAGSTEVYDSQTGIMLTRSVTATNLKSAVLLTGRVEGNVETVLDTPRALLLGLASGVALGSMILIGNLLNRKKR